jgi:uncharacterized membrane protein YqjE
VTDAVRGKGLIPRGVLRRLALVLARAISARTAYVAALWRHEAHRLIALLALSIAAALFVVGAVSFAMLGVVLALWETRRVLAFVIVAGVFALMAAAALGLIARSVRSVSRLPAAKANPEIGARAEAQASWSINV